jgi:5-methylthioadenosine/S-adenosylhomocysteine deaminase
METLAAPASGSNILPDLSLGTPSTLAPNSSSAASARTMMPARDPLRSLVYTTADRAIHKVFIDGHLVVDQGKVLTLDHAAALEALTEARARTIASVPRHDWVQRQAGH